MTQSELYVAFGAWLVALSDSALEAADIWIAGTGGPRDEIYATMSIVADSSESVESVFGSASQTLIARRVATIQVDVFGPGALDVLAAIGNRRSSPTAIELSEDDFALRSMGQIRDLRELVGSAWRERGSAEFVVAYSEEINDASRGVIDQVVGEGAGGAGRLAGTITVNV